MTNAPENPSERFEKSAARAALLAESASAGREPLRFAAGLSHAQAAAARAVLEEHRRAPLLGGPSDWVRVGEPLRAMLRFLGEGGPLALRGVASGRAEAPAEELIKVLEETWASEPGAKSDFLSRAVLRPYAAAVLWSGLGLRRGQLEREGCCPACGAPPAISVRRPAPGSDGAARFLGCIWCGTEWPITRVRCPSCGETDPETLPTWQSDRYPGARVEACDHCRRYLKSIDLGVDGLAVPEVDELRSLALDLWAQEQGYTRIEPGLAGI